MIFLDSGTTTLEVAKYICNKKITVVTNDLNIGCTLINYPNITLFITGGELRRGTNNLIGNKAISFFDGILGKKLFLGVEGIDVDTGLTIPDLEEVLIKKQMMKSVDEVIVVADHSKLGRSTMGVIAPLSAAQMLVTDSCSSENVLEPIRDCIPIIIASEEIN